MPFTLPGQAKLNTFDTEAARLHCLEVEQMKRYRLLSRIFDARAGAIAFRTALDRRNEEICMRKAAEFRKQLASVNRRIASYRQSWWRDMETKFTPGPWSIEDARTLLRDKKECDHGRRPITDQTVEANAHLIAAAPDLYEALDQCQKALALMVSPEAIASSSVTHAWAAATAAEATARATLAKARGDLPPDRWGPLSSHPVNSAA